MAKYKSVIEMVKKLSSNSFFTQFLLSNIHREFHNKEKKLLKHACYQYQCYCRIYLDEYPEQKELRMDFGSKLILSRMVIDMLEKATFTTNTYESYHLNPGETIKERLVEFKPGTYFYNRWIKRN